MNKGFILKGRPLSSVDRVRARAVLVHNVATLNHKVFDDSVKRRIDVFCLDTARQGSCARRIPCTVQSATFPTNSLSKSCFAMSKTRRV